MSKVVSVERSEKIPINYLSFKSKQYLPLLQRRISNVLKKGEFFFGGEVAEFEQQLKQLFKRPYVMSVASGHDALVLAIRALQLDPGAEVLLQANAYPTAFAVVEAGCRLRLVDCDENGQIDLEDVKRKITSKTKLIIPVHLYGSCCDMTKLMTLSADTGIPILEDCAQSFGSTWQGKLLGTFGKMSCFSFYPTKNLGTAGDGGAIITKDKQIGNYCREARQYGEKERYHSQFLSGHSRLTEIQAAVLNVYLPFFEQEMKKKKKRLKWYVDLFRKNKFSNQFRVLKVNHPSLNACEHLLVLEAADRDRLKVFLESNQIETGIHYPVAIHQAEAFHFLGYKKGDFPLAERLAKGIISLPYHQYLKKTHVQRVVGALKDFYSP